MLRLLTFGGLELESDDSSTAPRLMGRRLGLLAVLAAAGDRGISRDRVASLFWSDSDDERARQSLRQTLYGLRHDLGLEVVRSVDRKLVLNLTAIGSDVAEFKAALAVGDRARAVALARGPFLDSFYLAGSAEFGRWVEEERGRIAADVVTALTSLATDATRSDQRDAAVEWWRQLTIRDPLSGRFALGYLKALGARGDRAEALAYARRHEAVVRRELEADPDPEVRRLEAELRAMPAPEVVGPPTAAVVVSPLPEFARVAGMANGTSAAQPPNVERPAQRDRRRRVFESVGAVAALLLAVTAVFARPNGWLRRDAATPTFAVGFIKEDGLPDSLRMSRVLTDMLATNLARVEGLAVLANSRLLELMHPGPDSAADYSDAARRAGASELLEGQVRTKAVATLELEMRRVELRTGIVKDVYRVTAADRYALVDSVTQAIARRFLLVAPRTSVASATTPSPVAYRLYEEGLHAYFQTDRKAAQRLMHAAVLEDSTFAMAAYYEASMAVETFDQLPDGRHVTDARRTALRLAARAPDRERLTITADLLADEWAPRAQTLAESLTTRFPDDPRALITLAKVRSQAGDWAGAVRALERAIALDSVGEIATTTNCRFCRDLGDLAEAYFWWDSLPAAERTARRYLRARPGEAWPLWVLATAGARAGDSTTAYNAFRRFRSAGAGDPSWKFDLDLILEAYDELERDVRPYLASSLKDDWTRGTWALLIELRNEGRLHDASRLHRTGSLPGFPAPTVERGGPDDFNEGILAFERGDPRASAAVFGKRLRYDLSRWAPGYRARHLAWNGTLQGMALAAAGDTLALRQLADSVEQWGRGSAYGRDRKAHHYLRGLVLAAAGHHEDAAREYRDAMHSPSLGFTRVNYELARCLLKLDRPQEAVAALQPALRGVVDASNLYITRTELHELLAQAFDRANMPDSAAAHYRAVVHAWRRADPSFEPRRSAARSWLARHQQIANAHG